MFASPFEYYLANLRGKLVAYPHLFMTAQEAHDKLTKLTGQDFGYDAMAWEEYGFKNELFLNPPVVRVCIANLRGMVSSDSKYFIPREKALSELRRFTEQDFADDYDLW